MNDEYVQKLGEALIFLGKAETIIKKIQIEISLEMVRQENKKEKINK